MRWKDGILVVLISGTAGYLLRGYFSLGGLEIPPNILWLALSFLAGAIGGSDLLAFFTTWYEQRKEKQKEERDSERIYNWLYEKTKHLEHCTVGSPELTNTWPSTEEISSAVDLTEERVNYICTIDKRIHRQEKSDLWPNQELEKRWAIREFVR